MIALAGRLAAALVLLAVAGPALADRVPVLGQIDLPHPYYFREMYLPQLTTGPSSPAFSPDGKALIYSMGGSLWRQNLDGDEAVELTHVDGYDYQPDWSHDGRQVVFTRYRAGAMELWRLDLATGRETQLTSGGAVNVEPRYSPDDKTLAFVSTKGTGHFVLTAARIGPDGLGELRAVIPDRRSAAERYYYSPFDDAISPSWTPDGRRLVFISNREINQGSGGLWQVPADGSAPPALLLDEETNWRAHPEVAPDGRRILYSSYRGRQWHQLWLTTLGGALPLPLTFGEFDRTEARFSPDAAQIAFVSNQDGSTSLWLQTLVGGATRRVEPRVRQYRIPMAPLRIDLKDERGNPVAARVGVVGADDRAYAPDGAWMRADDGYDPKRQPFESHYFHCDGACVVTVPQGRVRTLVSHGMDYALDERTVTVGPDGGEVSVALAPLRLPPRFGAWTSADLHVHMNYGGHYRATSETLMAQARAEHLDAVYNLVVNKEERVPDIAGFLDPPRAERGVLLMQGQEYHSSYWGHLGLLDLADHFITPDFTAYAGTAMASAWPHNGVIADLAHAQGALVGYVHPFDAPVRPATDASLTNALPADVAHGKVDYYEVVGFSDHHASAEVWYRLLNLGFRIPTGAGTDAMSNFASLRGPVGMNRVFLNVAAPATPETLHAALKSGLTFATNAPLLGLQIEGQGPGGEIARGAGSRTLAFRASLRSIVPVDHLELVSNGRVVRTLALTGDRRSADAQGVLSVPASGWIVLRAWADKADPHIMDIYPYATTSPVYVTLAGAPPRSADDAAYFVKWLDRVIDSAGARADYNSAREKADTLDYLRSARATFDALRQGRRQP